MKLAATNFSILSSTSTTLKKIYILSKKYMPISFTSNCQMLYDKKDAKNPLWIFQTNEHRIMWILSKRQVWDRNIEFSFAELRFLIKFVVIPQTLKWYFSSLPDENLLIFTGKHIHGHHTGFVILKTEFTTIFSALKNLRVIVFRPIIVRKKTIEFWVCERHIWSAVFHFLNSDFRIIMNPKSLE